MTDMKIGVSHFLHKIAGLIIFLSFRSYADFGEISRTVGIFASEKMNRNAAKSAKEQQRSLTVFAFFAVKSFFQLRNSYRFLALRGNEKKESVERMKNFDNMLIQLLRKYFY